MTISWKVDLVTVGAGVGADPRGPGVAWQLDHVQQLAAALAAAGHDVTVWTRRDGTVDSRCAAVDRGFTVRPVEAGPPRSLPEDELLEHLPAFAAALRTAWATRPPEVAHAHLWEAGLATLAAARELAVPVVTTFHGLDAGRRGTADRRAAHPSKRSRAERHLAHVVDRTLAASTDERYALLRIGVSRDRIAVVPPGVDVVAFSPDGHAHRREDADGPRVVALGGLGRGCGVDEGIVALTAVPDAELVVAGGAGPGDPDIARLRAFARACRVGARVRFIGPVPHREVPALLRSADVVLCGPWDEPHGTVVLEAMACGRAVVASAVGVPADAVVDGVTGLLVPPHRPREISAALRHVLSSPTTAMAMGTAARDRAEKRYGWEWAARATGEVYAELYGRPVAEPTG